MHPLPALPAILVAVTLVGCGAGAPSSAPSPADVPSLAQPSRAPTPTPGVPESLEPIPSDDVGQFTCELPIVEGATTAIANITDVRIGGHDGYDRFVIEFAQGTPELSLERAAPPFTQDGSGLPVEVRGDSFLGLVLRGGTRQTDAGTSSFDGPSSWDADLPALVHVVQAGDFERQSTWYLGLTHEACVRVLVLDEPPRIVIDVEHPDG